MWAYTEHTIGSVLRALICRPHNGEKKKNWLISFFFGNAIENVRVACFTMWMCLDANSNERLKASANTRCDLVLAKNKYTERESQSDGRCDRFASYIFSLYFFGIHSLDNTHNPHNNTHWRNNVLDEAEKRKISRNKFRLYLFSDTTARLWEYA